MAHKGKLYKLWFRRDAAWNVNNYRQAFPEAYSLTFHNGPSSARYAVADLGTVLGVNLNKTYTRVWTSEPVGGFFDNAYWRLTTLSEPNDPYEKFRFEMRHSAVIETPLANIVFDVQHKPTSPFNIILGGVLEVQFLSPDITWNPESATIEFLAAGYERYNP